MKRYCTLLFALILVFSNIHGGMYRSCTAAENEDNPFRHAFPEPVILIDAGHGGIDGGTSYGGILEKDITLEIGRRLYMILRSHGYRTILNRTGDYALSDDNRWSRSRSRHLRDLAQRKQLSEELPSEIVVSLHVNWGRNKAKRGPIVLHQNEGRSVLLASSIQNALNSLNGTSSLPQHGKPFYLLKHVDCPAVIIETGFLSNAKDRAMLTSKRGQQKIAEALYGGILAYFTAI
ncbi:N-acetylmuramoyl-L-alanine amidase family protein [Paenibacillus fonticola]|uniref:N-acetylmuramoyl-L-alanine amidase family protein n=1 Tax=Paenibacillus fonticola TaxID=379896 RepID=UPI00036F52E2|nr:N-acetylmuramoyl-L-alanine amidase [Paenibacillus fonticola]